MGLSGFQKRLAPPPPTTTNGHYETDEEDKSTLSDLPIILPASSGQSPSSVVGSTLNSSTSDLSPGGKYSMMEFAMMNFRESPYRYEMKRSDDTGSIHGTFQRISSLKAKSLQRLGKKKRGAVEDWTWKEQADMVKWSKSPVQASLLKIENPKINKLALECCIAIMRYQGDYPLTKGQRPIDPAYTLLMACHNHHELRDEVFCLLMKQTTNNRSSRHDSCQQGWRLMAIITSFYSCSDNLRSYLLKYFETAAYNNQHPHTLVAQQCLHNIRQTFKFGGRKNVPSVDELQAVTAGRFTKRQVCVLPGGTPVLLSVRSSTVFGDGIDHVCETLSIQGSLEREEYAIFYVIEQEGRYSQLTNTEYIFDVTRELVTQKKEYYFLFQRTSWVFPLQLDSNFNYIDVMYHQALPDYLDGFLIPVHNNTLPTHVKEDIVYLAALQLKVGEKTNTPTQKDIRFVIPRTCINLEDMKIQQWTNAVTDQLHFINSMSIIECKKKLLETLSAYPLFGSTFFSVPRVLNSGIQGECLMAISRKGLHFLHHKTHEVLMMVSLGEVLSSRHLTTDRGDVFIDIKTGDLMKQTVIRVETEQGRDVEGLITQYTSITSALKSYTAAPPLQQHQF